MSGKDKLTHQNTLAIDQHWARLREHHSAIIRIAFHGPTEADANLVKMVFSGVSAELFARAADSHVEEEGLTP